MYFEILTLKSPYRPPPKKAPPLYESASRATALALAALSCYSPGPSVAEKRRPASLACQSDNKPVWLRREAENTKQNKTSIEEEEGKKSY